MKYIPIECISYNGTYNGLFTHTDLDLDLDSDSEGFPYGYNCTMYKFHIAEIWTRILILNGYIENPSPSLKSESANMNQPLRTICGQLGCVLYLRHNQDQPS